MIKIILCALNEAENLAELLPNINRELQKFTHDYEIILCLDGTSDESYNLILDFQKTYPIKFLEPQNQLGLGFAYKRLFLEVIKNSADDDLIISLDADNTHSPQQIKELIEHYYFTAADLIIASRFCPKSITTGFPLHRKFISKATSIFLQILFPIKTVERAKLKDYSSGYRAYKALKLKELYKTYGDKFIIEKDFIYTCEILLNLQKIHAKFAEIPLIYNYDKKIGKSKLKILQNFRGLLLLILRYKINISH